MIVAVPDPPLSGDGLVLRLWGDVDIVPLVACCADEEFARWLDQVPQPYTERDARDYIAQMRRNWREGTAANFAITKAGGEPIGSIGVHWLDHDQGVAEVGYWVANAARGQGIATNVVRLVARWALGEVGAERLQLRADEENLASCRVAEKAGFTREGLLRSVRYNARLGRRSNFVMYSLLPDELPQ